MDYKQQYQSQEPSIKIENFEETIPLCFNTIYYVEKTGNDSLNELVRQCFQRNPNSRLPRDLQKLTYRFHYLTQADVQTENLRNLIAKTGADTDSLIAIETIGLIRKCLHADTGGHLIARQLPKLKKSYHEEEDDSINESLISFPLHEANYSAEQTATQIQNFVIDLAKADFTSLSGVSYYRYYYDKHERRTSTSRISSSLTISLLVLPLNIPEIDKEMQETINTLHQKGYIDISSDDDTSNSSNILRKIADAIENNNKLDKFCKLQVDKHGVIFIETPQGGKLKCNFGRGRLGRALYILFLRQIERAAKDLSGKTAKTICVKPMDMDKEKEMLTIYKKMEPSLSPLAMQRTIKEYCKDTENDRSKINKFFERTFYLNVIEKDYPGKHYSIKIVDQDPITGQSLHAVGLDADDFKLGEYSIDKLP